MAGLKDMATNKGTAKEKPKPTRKTTAKKAAPKAPQVIEEATDTETEGKGRTKKISLYVTPDTWRALQLQKIDEGGRPVNDIINDAVAAYLQTVGGPEVK